MLLHLCRQKVSVHTWVHWHERFTEASREGCLWFLDTNFCSCDLCSVTRDEVVGCLFWRETRNRWKNTKGVAGQEDDVLRVTAAGIHGAIIDEFDWVRAARVLCFTDIGEVGHTVSIENNVLKNGSSTSGGSKNFWLVFFGQIDEFCIASTFEVEDTVGTPSVLIITDECTLWIG